MNTKSNIRFLTFALPFAIFGLYFIYGRAGLSANSELTLTVLAVDGAHQDGATSAGCDFGEFSLLDGPNLEHTFILRNTNAVPLEITRIRPTCGCTNVRFNVHGPGRKGIGMKDSGNQKLPVTVPAGSDIDIRAAIDSGHLDDGPFTKSVLITLAGNAFPSLTLNLSGTVHPALLMEPADADFGQAHTGNAQSMTITLYIDPKLLTGRRVFKVTCSVPDIAVSRPIDQQMASAYMARRYKLTLGKHMRIASFYGQLIVTTNAANGRPLILRPHNSFIRGKIFGDFTASPDYVSFGSPLRGSSPKQTVTITGASPEAIQGITVRSMNPWILVKTDAQNAMTKSIRVIKLSISPNAPAGGIRSEVIVRTRNGVEMALPVQGFIRKAAGGSR